MVEACVSSNVELVCTDTIDNEIETGKVSMLEWMELFKTSNVPLVNVELSELERRVEGDRPGRIVVLITLMVDKEVLITETVTEEETAEELLEMLWEETAEELLEMLWEETTEELLEMLWEETAEELLEMLWEGTAEKLVEMLCAVESGLTSGTA